jgi:signal transduction histidine kinase
MSPRFRSVRSRVTTITTIVVGAALALAGVGLLNVSRRSLVDDVRGVLGDNLSGARDLLNASVVTELTLLSLGQEVEPESALSTGVPAECLPVLVAEYGPAVRPFSTYQELGDLAPDAAAAYEACAAARDPYRVSAIDVCEAEAVAALGNPDVTFTEYRLLLSSESYQEAYQDCLVEELRADDAVAAAADVCDPVLDEAFAGIDVLDTEEVDRRMERRLGDYAACMRGAGVPSYPDLTVTAGPQGISVLAGASGAAVVLPSLASVRAGVDRFGTTVAVVVPLLVLDLAVLTWFLVARALRPVEQIRSEVDLIRSGELDRRVPETGAGDEIDQLAATMNRMLDRLEQTTERQRQFVSDASHELRSPLASIRTQLEVAVAHPDRLAWREVAAGVLEEGGRMEALVDDLLALARADEGAVEASDDVVALGEVARTEAAGRASPPVFDVSDVADVAVRGDEGALRRVIRNLLDNAARHAVSVVRVAMTPSEGAVLLAVEDDGSGIPDEERERVFERFTRLEEARTRDAGGTGLGLAVVRAVVEAHGGSVRVVEGELGGARVEVWIPSRSTQAPQQR